MSVPLHCWVHCSDDHKYSTGKKGAQESEVFCSRKFSFKDAFAVKPVPKYQLEDFDYVMAARLPTLISYVQAVTDDKRVDRYPPPPQPLLCSPPQQAQDPDRGHPV